MSAIQKRMGANLPHWTADGATYSVTFRLADAIPEAAQRRLTLELNALERPSNAVPSLILRARFVLRG